MSTYIYIYRLLLLFKCYKYISRKMQRNNKVENGEHVVFKHGIIKNVTLRKRKSNYRAITKSKNAVREIVIQLKNE